MGFLSRNWRRTKNWTAENAGKIARGAAVAAAASGATTVCLIPPLTPLAPACGVAAAAATDAIVGGPIERNVGKLTKRAAERAEAYLIDTPDGPQPPPPIRSVSGLPKFRADVGGREQSLWDSATVEARAAAASVERRSKMKRAAITGAAVLAAIAVTRRLL